MQTLLGFDYGQARIGVALAKEGAIEPLATYSLGELWVALSDMILLHDPSSLIVGLPRNLDGNDTDQTVQAKEFGNHLATLTGLPVVYQDEAMSSERALERLGSDTKIADRKKVLDQIAAQIILEDYMKEHTA